MKLLTLNFLTCAVKNCKSSPSSFPLQPRECSLEKAGIDFQPLFIQNILPRVHWDAFISICAALGLSAMLPSTNPLDDVMDTAQADIEGEEQPEKQIPEEVLQKLHTLLMETGITEGKLVCGNCGFEYPVKEGVGNFLLPPHLV